MGATQSAQHARGRELPVAGASRVRGPQGDAKTSQSRTTVVTDVSQQPHRNIIGYTSRLMRESISEAYTFDFCSLRLEEGNRVSRVTCRRSGRKAEALVVCKHLGDPLQLEALKKELSIWLSLDHPHVSRLLEVFEDERTLYLVSEYCPEDAARAWALQMTQAIGYLHGCGVVHRSLRLESWQLCSSTPFAPLKLYGFSHATRWDKKEGRLNAACGVLSYTSPGQQLEQQQQHQQHEQQQRQQQQQQQRTLYGNFISYWLFVCLLPFADVLLGRYTDACDMWSLGVIVFQLLCGHPPFSGSREDVIRQILSAELNLDLLERAGVSDEAKAFVLQLMTLSPHTRLTPQRALEHPWLFGNRLTRELFPANCATALVSFAGSTTIRRAALLMCAYCLNNDEGQAASELFAATVHAAGGCLTMEDVKRALQREQAEPYSHEEVEDVFDCLDVNKNGEVTLTAFAASMIGVLVEPADSLLQKAFSKVDVDGDGRLSLDDFRWAFGDPCFGHSLSAALAQEETEDGRMAFSHFVELIRTQKKPNENRLSKRRSGSGVVFPATWLHRMQRSVSSSRLAGVSAPSSDSGARAAQQRRHSASHPQQEQQQQQQQQPQQQNGEAISSAKTQPLKTESLPLH
ncbi:hypothetical protein Esti_003835 [Eimeria stiedai]